MMNNNLKKIFVVGFLLLVNVSYSQQNYNIDSIEKNIDKYLKYFSGDNPGAVVSVMKKGDILFNKAYGLSDVPGNKKLENNEAFNLANLSKMFTAMAIFKIAEKNKLDIDNTLTEIFFDFPTYGSKVKIRHLINHTSGLPDYDTDKISNQNELIGYLKNQKETKFLPGAKWEYSNSDYPLLVEIIEKVSGKTYNDYVHKNFFKKIKTENTFLIEDIHNNPNIAKGHIKEDEQYIVTKDLSTIYGEQGIFMNTEDFARWDKALYTNKFLDCETLSAFFSRGKLNNGDNIPSYYGHGLVLMERNSEKYWWHGGSAIGYTNMYLHLPDYQLTVLILANRQDAYDFLKLSIYIAKEFEPTINL
jgi:CubicO group peptidase (beta-lactamase class C family)